MVLVFRFAYFSYNEFRKTVPHANVYNYLMATLRKQLAPGYDYANSGLYQMLHSKEQAEIPRRRPSGNANATVREGDKRIVGYYTSWGSSEMNDQMLTKLTHVIYAFAEVKDGGSVDFGSDAARERLQLLMDLAKSYPDVKIMFAVGGGGNSQYFSKTAASPDERATFVSSIVQLFETYGSLCGLIFIYIYARGGAGARFDVGFENTTSPAIHRKFAKHLRFV